MATKKLTIVVRENVEIGFIGLSRWRETQRLRTEVSDEDFKTIVDIVNKKPLPK